MTSNSPTDPDELNELPLLRPGAVARQLGMSVETLRAWENRYGLTSSHHSGGGQRLYSQEDVQRLAHIKRLVDEGHRIGQLAALPLEALKSLDPSPEAAGPAGQTTLAGLRLVLAGPWISSTGCIEALRQQQASVSAAVQDLEELRQSSLGLDTGVALLLVESAVLDPGLGGRMESVRRSFASARVVILYRFGSPEMVARLTQAGHQLVRKPMDGIDPAWLCELVRRLDLPPGEVQMDSPDVPAPRFSEAELAQVSQASTRMQCECPRHLAELLTALVGFERYSRQCEDESEEEAALHRELCLAAGRARLPLEETLQRLAQVKGISLPSGQ
ncbi:MerR family transcriptional regulator [Herbaspirillum seropedicae]|uniref:MerR-family transcription regulator protein n=1 Tax=Herbaspirillum seropedicae (strain SmR1) TaxID=757424 RepID=D8IP58_HERSS|nr:MerR family transcriptional regulator [Herbaspirillum seropedicae]ADJ62878.1 MerR-family transcription regulator protein [Herbaspirillum seropedicae SmR1]AKN64967.1 MerR family transcriptional regulator [Herbaspirillum seropedicae]NQE31232.1 MerR family transcriptional regulator [Herbaspirillum seropedicae]UMU20913.1 MerR family transcriptional regulator [Herbaspirillum seropedicae]